MSTMNGRRVGRFTTAGVELCAVRREELSLKSTGVDNAPFDDRSTSSFDRRQSRSCERSDGVDRLSIRRGLAGSQHRSPKRC